MPAPFAALARAASRTVDAVYAEGFTLQPRTAPLVGAVRDVNARPVVDTARLAVAFRGVWVAPGAMMNAHGRAMSDATTKAIAGEKPRIDVDVARLPQRPVQGDLIIRTDTGERYQVTDYLPVDLGRAQIHLAEIR
ncbi:hypothetical protein OPKNFCMD_3842 [Methylobacterium crusticola]|uniref:Head-tail adaptor protein n=1 Tax=Methylobacterium crusticola TaxID=1697972 RepID=A0ABQ4R0B3_9HYPH|nr:hypothetical protein [Methylobacterium crusticola]GJD51091.1 hypothetical protein OPKNFCMD_3842 [Methylobacterium crusticola]